MAIAYVFHAFGLRPERSAALAKNFKQGKIRGIAAGFGAPCFKDRSKARGMGLYNSLVMTGFQRNSGFFYLGVLAQGAAFLLAFVAIAAALFLTQSVTPFRYMGF